MAFCQPCKTTLSQGLWDHWPLRSTNQNQWGIRLLLMAISIYPVDSVHLYHLLRAQHHCLCPNGRENPPLACPPTPTTPLTSPTHPPTPLYMISMILQLGVVKNYLQNQQWIMHSKVSYETLATRLLYLYSKSGMATMKHRRTTVASIFQSSISRNTKCDNLVGFYKSSHINIFLKMWFGGYFIKFYSHYYPVWLNT